jgi:E3 ubiquitin-protein ligase ATL6/9/15/31/42/55
MNNITCSICQENECDMITECNHNFHRRCLNRWLERRQTCPVCRHILSSEDSEDDSEIGVDFTLETEYD